MIIGIKKVNILFILLCVVFFITHRAEGAGSDFDVSGGQKKKVLLLHSYHKGLSWTDGITSTIEEKLSAAGNCELYVEYIDAKRHPAEKIENEFLNLLKTRYKNEKFMAIIAVDNNALAFLKKYRKTLFPDTPVVFCGINDFSESLIDSSGWFTGIIEKTDAASNFRIMKKINPGLRNCIVVGDDTPTGRAEISAAMKALGNETEGVKISYWTDLSTRVLLRQLSGLNRKDDAVLLTAFNRDINGRYFSYEEIARIAAGNTSAPIYGLWDFYIGTGILGGNMVTAGDQGLAVAGIVLKILNGEDHLKIPIQRDAVNRILFDYAAMERFSISSGSLPSGSTVLNAPHGFIRDHAGLIIGTLLLIFSEGAALLFLFHMYLKSRKQYVRELRESERKYRILVDNSFDVIYRINTKGIITFVSKSWTANIGHDVEDVEGKSYLDFVHPEDVESSRDFLKRLILSKERQSGFDYRLRHRDGSWRIYTSSAVPIMDEDGRFIGFVGIAKDITDRKKAEDEIKSLLHEKEILLKEVHHRIKNNMNTLSGILYLQMDTVKNEPALAALNDARSRIESMMVIYDRLYRSADFRSISVKEYITNLVAGISSTFAGSSAVEVELRIDDCILDSEVLFPAGIILNELMSNVYKYAFPGGGNGIVFLSFSRKSDEIMEIIFRDNGSGMPASVLSGESPGFGLNLVKILVDQIKGTLQINVRNGTEYIICFPARCRY